MTRARTFTEPAHPPRRHRGPQPRVVELPRAPRADVVAPAAPRVSVIIATFNHARFVRSAIDSALAQRGVKAEIIVVDDGSTDETPAVLAGYGDRIRTVRIENGGPSRARNVGCSMARGDWLAFLDSDDIWEPDKLRIQLDHAGGAGLVYTDRRGFGDVVPGRELLSSIVTLHEGDVFEQLLSVNFIALSSVMMQRSWFEKLGGFCEDLFGSEDWDLWLRYAATGRIALVPQPLLKYRKHPAGISRDPVRMGGTHLRVLQRALQTERADRVEPKMRRRLKAIALEATAEFEVIISRRSAIGYYLRAFANRPRLAPLKGIAKCFLARR